MPLTTDNSTDASPSGKESAGGHEARPVSEFHIIVGESTPEAGGMCAHMELLADGLNPSGAVHVWAPEKTALRFQSPDVQIHKTLGRLWLGGFRRTGQELNRFRKPRRLLVYWVPHAYAYKSMNLAFCVWLWFRRVFSKDRIELMVQECFMPFSKTSWRQNVIAAAHRLMTFIVLASARHVWIALPDYQRRLRPYTLGRRIGFTWLPVPSNVAVIDDPQAVAQIRKRLAPRGFLMGHFGTFGRSITQMLEDILPALLAGMDSNLVLLGSGGEEFRQRLIRLCPDAKDRIHASGYLDDAALSSYLSACDVMIQPYPDGMTARRGSALAPLAHGRPVITNPTACTESLWAEEGAVVLAAATGAAFLEAARRVQREKSEAKRVSDAARGTYLRYFEPSHMVKAIQSEPS